jgi:hypothetical protein
MGERARQTAQLQNSGSQVTEQARDTAQQMTVQAKGRLQEEIDNRTTQFGDQIGSNAQDIRTVAEELRKRDRDAPAKVAEQVADGTERVAQYLRDADGDRILSDIENIGRRRPWAVIAGGLALGFLASRFLKASSTERYQAGRSEPYYGNTTAGAYDSSRAAGRIPADVDIHAETRGRVSTNVGTYNEPSSGSTAYPDEAETFTEDFPARQDVR